MKEYLNDKFTDAKSKIIAFLTQPEIQLTADEEKMLARWESADTLMQEKKSFKEITDLLCEKHSISKFTAQNDILTAQEVFGRARKIDKRYFLFHKLQRQEADLERFRKKIFNLDPKEGEEGWPLDAKDIMALAKLEEAITYTLNSMPSETPNGSVKRPVMVFTVVNNGIASPMTASDALQEADKIIHLREVNDGTD